MWRWLSEVVLDGWSRPQAAREPRSCAARRHTPFRAGRWRIPQSGRTLDRVAAIAQRDWRAALAYLRKVDPWVFEEVLLTALARRGYRIERNARYTGDGGIDGRVWISGRQHLLQVKRYAAAIRPNHVRAFCHLCQTEGRPGVLVHTGRTGPASVAILSDYPEISLLSGPDLVRFLARAASGPREPDRACPAR